MSLALVLWSLFVAGASYVAGWLTTVVRFHTDVRSFEELIGHWRLYCLTCGSRAGALAPPGPDDPRPTGGEPPSENT
jgi:hypothetical protein